MKASEYREIATLATKVENYSDLLKGVLTTSRELFDHPSTSKVPEYCGKILDKRGDYRVGSPQEVSVAYHIFGIFSEWDSSGESRVALRVKYASVIEVAQDAVRELIQLFPQGKNSICKATLPSESLIAVSDTLQKAKKLLDDYKGPIEVCLSAAAEARTTMKPVLLDRIAEPEKEAARVSEIRVTPALDAARALEYQAIKYGFFSSVLCATSLVRSGNHFDSLLYALSNINQSLFDQTLALPSEAFSKLCWRVRAGELFSSFSMSPGERDFTLLGACIKLRSSCESSAHALIDFEIQKLSLNLARKAGRELKHLARSLTVGGIITRQEARSTLNQIRAFADSEIGANLAAPPEQPERSGFSPARSREKLRAAVPSHLIRSRLFDIELLLSEAGFEDCCAAFQRLEMIVYYPAEPSAHRRYLDDLHSTLKEHRVFFDHHPTHPLHPSQNPTDYSALNLARTRTQLRTEVYQEEQAKLRAYAREYLRTVYGYSERCATDLASQLTLAQIEEREVQVQTHAAQWALPLTADQLLKNSAELFSLREQQLEVYFRDLRDYFRKGDSIGAYLHSVASAADNLGVDLSSLRELSSAAKSFRSAPSPSCLASSIEAMETAHTQIDGYLLRQYLTTTLGMLPSGSTEAASHLSFHELTERISLLKHALISLVGADAGIPTALDGVRTLLGSDRNRLIFSLDQQAFSEYAAHLTSLFATAQEQAPHFFGRYSFEKEAAVFLPDKLALAWREFNACRLADFSARIKSDTGYDARITIPLLRKFLMQSEEQDNNEVRQASLHKAVQMEVPSLSVDEIRADIKYLIRRDVLLLSNNRLALSQVPEDFQLILQVLRSERQWGRLSREEEETVQASYMQQKYGQSPGSSKRVNLDELEDVFYQTLAWVNEDRYDSRVILALAVTGTARAGASQGLTLEEFRDAIMARVPAPQHEPRELAHKSMLLFLYKLKNYGTLVETTPNSGIFCLATDGFENSINHLIKLVQRAHDFGMLKKLLGEEK